MFENFASYMTSYSAITYLSGKSCYPFRSRQFRRIQIRPQTHVPIRQRWSFPECRQQTPFCHCRRSSSLRHLCCSSCSSTATEWFQSESIANTNMKYFCYSEFYFWGAFIHVHKSSYCVYAPLLWHRHVSSRTACCGHSKWYKLPAPSQHFQLYRKWCTRDHLQAIHHIVATELHCSRSVT